MEKSKAAMYGTKVEISLRKAQLTKWEKLEVAHEAQQATRPVDKPVPRIDPVDLDDL